MITISRRQIRTIRGVLRRSTLGIAHRSSLPPLQPVADSDQIRVRYRSADLAVEWVLPATGPAAGLVPLLLDALADLAGRDDAPLTLDPVTPDRTVARWADRGFPQVREYPIPTRPQPGAFPELPGEWAEVPGDLLDALAEATATTAAASTRYALDCLLLRAAPSGGEVIATDGHQILVRGGFAFPWAGDVLVRSSPLFATRDLPRDRPWSVGRTATHVVFRCSPCTIWLTVPSDVRYPRVDQIVPNPAAATARLRIDPADAAFLAGSLGRLPGADAPLAPVTVELNGRIAVRACGSAESAATAELVLSRSSSTGTPVRFGTDRNLLTRALRLGFTEVEVGEPAAPLVCRNELTTYAWQPLNPDSVLESNAELTRIESDPWPPWPISGLRSRTGFLPLPSRSSHASGPSRPGPQPPTIPPPLACSPSSARPSRFTRLSARPAPARSGWSSP